MLYFSKLNSIYYYTFNDIKYLSDINFKGQIRNSQKMVYLILAHPVHMHAWNYAIMNTYNNQIMLICKYVSMQD